MGERGKGERGMGGDGKGVGDGGGDEGISDDVRMNRLCPNALESNISCLLFSIHSSVIFQDVLFQGSI